MHTYVNVSTINLTEQVSPRRYEKRHEQPGLI
jgi:hypothetical protein